MTNTVEIPEEETAQDILDSSKDAVVSSMEPKDIDGVKLNPYSLGRQLLAGDLVDGPRQPFWTAIMIIWSCTLSKEEALYAHKDIIGSQGRAIEWAASMGFSLQKPVYDKWLALSRKLDAEIAGATKAIAKGDAENPNDGGQPDLSK